MRLPEVMGFAGLPGQGAGRQPPRRARKPCADSPCLVLCISFSPVSKSWSLWESANNNIIMMFLRRGSGTPDSWGGPCSWPLVCGPRTDSSVVSRAKLNCRQPSRWCPESWRAGRGEDKSTRGLCQVSWVKPDRSVTECYFYMCCGILLANGFRTVFSVGTFFPRECSKMFIALIVKWQFDWI